MLLLLLWYYIYIAMYDDCIVFGLQFQGSESLLYCVATLPLCSYFTSVRCGQEAIAEIVIKVGLTIRNPFTILLDKHL